jgi:hypothetical protein
MKMLTKIALLAVSVAAVSTQVLASVPETVNATLWDRGGQMGISTDVSTVRAGKVDSKSSTLPNPWSTKCWWSR